MVLHLCHSLSTLPAASIMSNRSQNKFSQKEAEPPISRKKYTNFKDKIGIHDKWNTKAEDI